MMLKADFSVEAKISPKKAEAEVSGDILTHLVLVTFVLLVHDPPSPYIYMTVWPVLPLGMRIFHSRFDPDMSRSLTPFDLDINTSYAESATLMRISFTDSLDLDNIIL